jgi:hypothetical protein
MPLVDAKKCDNVLVRLFVCLYKYTLSHKSDKYIHVYKTWHWNENSATGVINTYMFTKHGIEMRCTIKISCTSLMLL